MNMTATRVSLILVVCTISSLGGVGCKRAETGGSAVAQPGETRRAGSNGADERELDEAFEEDLGDPLDDEREADGSLEEGLEDSAEEPLEESWPAGEEFEDEEPAQDEGDEPGEVH